MALSSIDIGLEEIFADPEQRQEFFREIAKDEIAAAIRSLRKERGLSQMQFAERAGMKQSAVSRIEQASYAAWNFATLFRAADALDARIRVIIEKAEDAIADFLMKEEKNEELEAVEAEKEAPTPGDFSRSSGPIEQSWERESPFQRQPRVDEVNVLSKRPDDLSKDKIELTKSNKALSQPGAWQ